MGEPTETCPHCGAEGCEADWVDVGVGVDMQCGPYHCPECGACEIGPHDRPGLRTARELETGWYEPADAHRTCAPTVGGVLVGDYKAAKKLYEMGLLDRPGARPAREYVDPSRLGAAIVDFYLALTPRPLEVDLVTSSPSEYGTRHDVHRRDGTVESIWSPCDGAPA